MTVAAGFGTLVDTVQGQAGLFSALLTFCGFHRGHFDMIGKTSFYTSIIVVIKL